MSVKIKGIEGVTDKVHQEIQNLISKTETECLLKGAEVVKTAIIKEFGKFKDTGASINEIKISKQLNLIIRVKLHFIGTGQIKDIK